MLQPNTRTLLITVTTTLFSVEHQVCGQGFVWPTFANETVTRIIADPTVSISDTQEKDYAWGDVDQDGDIDLVCVRKEPWNTPGRFRNVLFMNEGVGEGHAINGVLVDRTLQFASGATDGGQGMLDATADRDVALVDVNGDGWLDVVTSTTYGEFLAKTISHPRIYINQGDTLGVWQGFVYEESRTPTMPITPHFCAVGVGDVTGDLSPDLYFVDYENMLEDRLWVNDGFGVFTDESTIRLTFEMRESDFGVHAIIADLNNDGVNDILKDRGSTTVTPPLRVTAAYNNPLNEGNFSLFNIIYNGDPYHIATGDLNNDGLLDIVLDDDGVDRFFLNQGNGPSGTAVYSINNFFPPDSNSFGGNIVICDINQDGHNDVFIADVDVDCCGCTRHMHFWRHTGDDANVAFSEEQGGIGDFARTGTHDVAVFDLNGDNWDDIIIGTCTGMSVWIAQPELAISFPLGLPPQLITPDSQKVLTVRVRQIAGAAMTPDSALLHVSINGSAFQTIPLAPTVDDLFTASLPAAICGDRVSFYVSAMMTGGATFTDPIGAPANTHNVVAANGTTIALRDELEGDVSGWTIQNHLTLTAGAWEHVDPVGSLFNLQFAAPDEDATSGAGNVLAFVTQNGTPGANAALSDVDDGPTHLISPTINLAGTNAFISYDRWFFSATGTIDSLTVAVSNDNGASWMPVTAHTTSSTGSAWENVNFLVSDYVPTTNQVRVRFTADDSPNNSLTEAGIDNFQVETIDCSQPCPGDCGGVPDGLVSVTDLLAVLSQWGSPGSCDTDNSGFVGVGDLLTILGSWGLCPS